MDGIVSSPEKPKAPACDATAKEESIRHACRIRDFGRLGALAESRGGFLSNELRKHACRFLFDAPLSASSLFFFWSWLTCCCRACPPRGCRHCRQRRKCRLEELQRHRDEHQVELDVH